MIPPLSLQPEAIIINLDFFLPEVCLHVSVARLAVVLLNVIRSLDLILNKSFTSL